MAFGDVGEGEFVDVKRQRSMGLQEPVEVPGPRDGPSGPVRADPSTDELALERAARAQAEETARRAKLLSAASATLAASLDAEHILERLAQLAIAHFADWAAVWLAGPGGLQTQPLLVAHANSAKRQQMEDLLCRALPGPESAFGVHAIARDRAPLFVERFDDALLQRLAWSDELLGAIATLDLRSVLVTPLISRDRVVGVLALATAESGRQFDAIDRELVNSLAWRAALAIDNAQLYRAARDAMAARDELLAFVSHDLRHPLQVILSAVGRLGAADLDEAVRADHVALVRRTMRRMQTLISDLLTVVGTEDRSALNVAPLDIEATASQVAAEFGPRCAEAGVVLRTQLDDALPAIPGDRDAIARVLANLVDNAIKVTPDGGTVTVAARRDGAGVAMSVSDQGPGLDPDRVAQLVSDAPPRNRSGLGLTIVRRLVDAHRGAFDVRALSSGGTEIVVHLPG